MNRLRYASNQQVGINIDSINIANVLMLLSRGVADQGMMLNQTDDDHRVFECKTCNRQFSSFQALGGHRASHKKPKLSLDGEINQDQTQSAVGKPKVHECSICGLEFAIGQALGGHMRRHRANTNEEGLVVEKMKSKNYNYGKRKRVLLDLNLPPLMDDDEIECRKLGFGLGMVDCFQ